MRTPPPVEFASAPSLAWRCALGGAACVAAAAPAAWLCAALAEMASWPWLAGSVVQAGLAIAAALATAILVQPLLRRVAGECTLRWDGADWVLCGVDTNVDQRGDADLMLDLGPWLLLRFRPLDRSRAVTWLPLSLVTDSPRAAMLRGALWSRRGGSRR